MTTASQILPFLRTTMTLAMMIQVEVMVVVFGRWTSRAAFALAALPSLRCLLLRNSFAQT
jgi:hypothetical protein